jgi:hypothetical protein
MWLGVSSLGWGGGLSGKPQHSISLGFLITYHHSIVRAALRPMSSRGRTGTPHRLSSTEACITREISGRERSFGLRSGRASITPLFSDSGHSEVPNNDGSWNKRMTEDGTHERGKSRDGSHSDGGEDSRVTAGRDERGLGDVVTNFLPFFIAGNG